MNLTTATPETADSTAMLTLDGRFDAFETEGFRTAFDELVDAGHSTVAVGMAAVQFIDSSALAELVRAMKHCRERGGELVIADPSDPVRVILELTKLDAAFEIRPR